MCETQNGALFEDRKLLKISTASSRESLDAAPYPNGYLGEHPISDYGKCGIICFMAMDLNHDDEAKVRRAIESNRESIRRLQAEVEQLTNLLELYSLKAKPQPLLFPDPSFDPPSATVS